METSYRLFSGAAAACAAWFAPVAPLVACTALFIGVDFLSGVAADRTVARRAGRAWYFESRKAWRTVVKMTLALTAIVMAWLIDSCVPDFLQLNLARLFTGFTCGVELWSFLENASQLSDAPLFRSLRRYVGRRIAERTGEAPSGDVSAGADPTGGGSSEDVPAEDEASGDVPAPGGKR